jgi:hypothetical protein
MLNLIIHCCHIHKDLIGDKLQRQLRGRWYISPLSRVLVALQFYANGKFHNTVGNTLKISQPSVSRCIYAVSYELTRISGQIINFSENLVHVTRGFYDIADIRGVIESTHVRIQGPHQHEAAFVNRKGYHSINLQAICTDNLHFFFVNTTQPGSSHDSTMLADRNICRDLKNVYFYSGMEATIAPHFLWLHILCKTRS